ncbi:MAG: HAD-IB family phosphatase [Thermoplasmata archaeon]|jgi:2-hydroxy-3-keto-5-methylthiopentenyl-1-phosphate phosphatase
MDFPSTPPIEPSPTSKGAAGRPPLRIFLDFDGTLVESNVAVDLVERFADDGVRVAHEVDEQLHRGEITLRQAWDRQAALLPWDRVPEMTGFVVREIPLRVGARELIDLLQKHSVPVVVLSGGLDFYIRAILDREGLEYPFLSDTSSKGPHGQLKVEHPHGHATCRQCGICKAQAIGMPLPVADRTIFIGDGSTDRFAAEVADIVFARRRLLQYCQTQGIECYPFEDFHPVTTQLRAWLEGAQPLPPRRVRGLAQSICPISRDLRAAAT